MLTAQAPAKINLCLYVGPRRPDGYHPVCTLMEKISLFDRLELRRGSSGGIRVTGVDVPDEQNTVWRAARALEEETGVRLDSEIHIDKQIPAGAGLAGGSSDAAAVLRLLSEAFDLSVPTPRLAALAAGIGADVPFFLSPGPMLATGAGELLEPVSLDIDYVLVVVAPGQAVSTADAYRRYDSLGTAADISGTVAGLSGQFGQLKSLADLTALLHNDLQPAAESLCGEIAPLKREMLAAGAAGALMSGSGSAVFGLFASGEEAAVAAGRLEGPGRRVWTARPVRA